MTDITTTQRLAAMAHQVAVLHSALKEHVVALADAEVPEIQHLVARGQAALAFGEADAMLITTKVAALAREYAGELRKLGRSDEVIEALHVFADFIVHGERG